MKRLLMLPLLLLASCDAANYPPEKRNVTLWTDPTTGCVYINYQDGIGNASVGSLSIRYLETGLPDCPGTRVSLQEPVQ